MTVRVAVNGFGRIGRAFFRKALIAPGIEIVAVNDLCDVSVAAHLLAYDSVAGKLERPVRAEEGALIVGEKRVRYFSRREPADLPWREEGVDLVLECTGRFTDRSSAAAHLHAGAKRVIISAPSPNSDLTVVIGVNQGELDPERHRIISNASCTTNCLAPPLKLLSETLGIRRAFFTTIHSYTNGQPLLDSPHPDLRRARAGALSMIPTTTGATKALCQVLPKLKGKIEGLSVRVPVPNVSLIDLVVEVSRKTGRDEVNEILRHGAAKDLHGIVSYSEEPLVSADLNGSGYSTVVDGEMTQVQARNLVRIVLWYDNENGFSRRLIDMVRLFGESELPFQAREAV